jgi:NADPH-dependent curcumin reductase CurA
MVSDRATRVVVLKKYANGTAVTESHFGVERRPLPQLAEGEVLLETLELSPDPYMRGRMMGHDNFYLPQLPLNESIRGFGVARVINSANAEYKPGEIVYGIVEWAEHSVWNARHRNDLSVIVGGDGSGLEQISPYAKPHARALDVVGITGITAYFAVTEVAKPRPGETTLISSAAGSVGSIAGQIAKLRGSRVVGLAGSDEKCRILTERLGFDAALNYKSGTLEAQLREVMPKGPDVYIDNVGGSLSQTVMLQMRWPARVVDIGQIATYDDAGGGWTVDLRPIHNNCLQLHGYHPMIFVDYIPAARAQLGHWLQTGKLVALDTVVNGIENAPKAFTGLFRGANVGKMIVHVAD